MTSPRIHDNILSCVGNTPVVRLNRVHDGARTPIYAKCEFMNPGGSVKDRIGLAIIEDAERRGAIRPGGTIVEGTSGNTGIGLAIAAAIKGYRCVFTIPDKMSIEKVRLLKAFGAEVIVTPTVEPDHPEYYVRVAKDIVEKTPNSYLANQFYNQVNPEAHYRTTGPELWEQMAGRIDVLVGGLGTGGTMSGTSRYLKERRPEIRSIGADPQGSLFKGFKETGVLGEGAVYKVEGIGNDKIPDTAWLDWIDEFRTVSDKESFAIARRLTREEGIFVGGSSGTAVKVAIDVAREMDDPNGSIVVFLPSTGERYLSKLHNDEWMRENRFLDEPAANVRDLMLEKPATSRELVFCSSTALVRDALKIMADKAFSQIPVIDHGECIGSLRESRVMGLVLDGKTALDVPVREILEAPFPVIGENESLEYVTRLLGRENTALLVRTGAGLAGIITRHDVIHSMTR
ncbi:MAG: pyridoxal-phosphate dependent enzyme [Planctomycetota bacterium]